MSIVSSVMTLNEQQADGSRIVFEQHTDNVGVVNELRYVAGPGVDVNAMLTQHAAEIETMLANAEINEVLNG